MVLFGVGIGKLCAKKENQAGIGDPQQYQNNGAGRTIGRAGLCLAEVEPQ